MEQIGLEGVFETAAFNQGLSTYMGGLDQASGKTTSSASTIGNVLGGAAKVAGGALLGIGTAAVGAGTAVFAGMMKAAATADLLQELSDKTGISVQRLQELQYAGGQLGVSLDSITGAQTRLIRSLYAAKDGTGAQADAFKLLGVSVFGADGKLLSADVAMGKVFDALSKISDPTVRDAIAMQLFGKSAQELNPLINAGSAGMATLTAEAHKMGAVVSTDAIGNFGKLQDTMDGLKSGLAGTAMTILSTFLPGVQGLATTGVGYLQQIGAAVSASGGDFTKLGPALATVLTNIANDIASKLPEMLQAGLTIIQSLLTAIMNSIPTLIPAALAIVKSLCDFLITNLPLLIDAALKIIIALAKGLADMLPTLIPAVVQMMLTIIQTLIENIPMLLDAASKLIIGLLQGMYAAIPLLWDAAPKIIKAIIDALILSLPILLEMAGSIIFTIVTGIIHALPSLIAAVPQIILAIVQALGQGVADLGMAGANLIAGLWDGIAAAIPDFIAKLLGFAGQIWDTIKKALGIGSPSKLFAITVGPFIPAGIWKGIEKGMPKLQGQLNASMQQLALSPSIYQGLTVPSLSIPNATAARITGRSSAASGGIQDMTLLMNLISRIPSALAIADALTVKLAPFL